MYGQIGIIGLENPQFFKRFISLFDCDYDLIDCALLANGDYFQQEGNGWRYQAGSAKIASAWQNLFHQSKNFKKFDETRDYLLKLLAQKNSFTNSDLAKIRADYLSECERNSNFEWSYYYIKYAEFRPARYGKYSWNDFENAPYVFSTMWTPLNMSENAYQPFLKAVDLKNQLSRESLGTRLTSEKYFVECQNDSYVIGEIGSSRVVERLQINQRDGIDSEDRIKKFKRWNKKISYGF